MSGVSQQFQAYVLELLAPLSPVARRMFRGAGIFSGGMMFGLLLRDTMYFRVDNTTRFRYETAGSQPFSYGRRGQMITLHGYYAVPDELFDQPDELLLWAREAVAAAHVARRRQ